VRTSPGTRLVIAQMLESDGPGGAEMVMLRLAEALRERGHEIVPVGPASGGGWLAEQFRQRGFEPEQFVLRSPVDWRCVRGMTQMLRRRGVDVVHSHEFTMAVYGAASARWLGRPHVVTMHGNQTMTKRWRRRMLLRAAFRFTGATVAVSEDTKRYLDTQLDLPAETLRVVPNGVPKPTGDRTRVRRELSLRPDELLVVATGSLVPRKGHAVLLRALAAQEATSPWRVAIAGNGPERGALEALAQELGIASRAGCYTDLRAHETVRGGGCGGVGG
jgi:glycosyltransferase involved in cell wall biosynthesis